MLVSLLDLYNNVLVSFFAHVGAKDEKLFVCGCIVLKAMLKMSKVYQTASRLKLLQPQ